ncbi:MAG TPA: hypothetical protein VLY84_00335 [Dysgonamonadaceae bacterium]|nr:hypothetical protein [Dysgonamonadaceae bacterium]
MYRNLIDVTSIEGIEVDAGSLWGQLEDGNLVLIDEDQHATHALTNDFVVE